MVFSSDQQSEDGGRVDVRVDAPDKCSGGGVPPSWIGGRP